MIRKDNRGAALITAIITIMFIAVLGTAILSSAYTNYVMKINNIKSKDNFYNAEIAIDELKMMLQSCGSSKGVKDFLGNAANFDSSTNSFTSACFPLANAKADDTMGTGTDNVTVTVDKIEYGSSSIVLKGVKATSTIDGYESNVKTDIVCSFPKGGKYKLDINDFSILTDSNVSIAEVSAATNANIYGYLYCVADKSKPFSNAYVNTDKVALRLDNGTTVNVLSQAAVINGDVVLTGNSCLNLLGGTVVITGNVYIFDNATLLCCSNVRVSGIVENHSKNYLSNGRVTEGTGIKVDEHLVNGSITKGLFQEFQVWYEEGGAKKYTEKITVADLAKEDHQVNKETMIGTENYKAALFQSNGGNSTAYGNGMANTLLISNGNIKLQSGTYVNSTILTSEKIVMDIQKVYITTKMSEATFEELKKLDLGLIHPKGINSISNPRLYEDGKSYDESRNMTYGDLLKPSSETSLFLSNLFNAADPTGGTEKVSIGFANWEKNAD